MSRLIKTETLNENQQKLFPERFDRNWNFAIDNPRDEKHS